MNPRITLLYNTLGLPAYWSACRSARQEMNASVEKISYGNHPRQYALKVTAPNSQPDKIAFYFHGGGWTFGRPETFVPAAIPWLAAGFTVVLPSYRRPPRYGMEAIVADCRAALAAFASPDIKVWHIGGISAGAHLAALLALTSESWTGYPGAPERALLCAGPLCLTQLWPDFLFSGYEAFDPFLKLEKSNTDTNWLLLHGTADALVNISHSRQFHDCLLETGRPARLITIPNGTHLDSGRWMFGGVGAEEVDMFVRG